jgi:patatin-like phospholipase/acyl hydrolase
MNRFRIRSLDGGGTKGTFTASIMAALEKDTGKAAAEYFDLITGTSTGGIVASLSDMSTSVVRAFAVQATGLRMIAERVSRPET